MTTTETAVATQVHRVYIKASPQAIWDAITKPEWTVRYGYRGRTEYDLRPGGAYRALATEQMIEMGGPEVMVDGEVIEADPPHRLVQTWHALFDPETAAEAPQRLTWEIKEEEGGISRLTVTHELESAPKTAATVAGDFDLVSGGGGWSWILSDLKTLLETGSSAFD
jgi:uncharacterized protein YndB with AHSA1/START domain